jgi:hypothetical protein
MEAYENERKWPGAFPTVASLKPAGGTIEEKFLDQHRSMTDKGLADKRDRKRQESDALRDIKYSRAFHS